MTVLAAVSRETEQRVETKLLRPGSGKVWLFAFVLAVIISIFIQKILLPIILPQLHAGHGLLLGGDGGWFHEQGAKLADLIARDGWKEFQLRPSGNSPIAVTAVVYYFTGIHEPWVLIPIHAALFALAAVGLFNIFHRMVEKRLALLALFPFLFFPSSVQLFSQIQKDTWAIAGFVWLVFVWTVVAQSRRISFVQYIGLIGISIGSSALIWLVRPYLCEVMLGALTCGTTFLFAWGLFVRPNKLSDAGFRRWTLLVFCLSVVAFFAADGPGKIFPWLAAAKIFPVRFARCVPRQANSLDRVLPSVIRSSVDSIINDRMAWQALVPHAGSEIDLDKCFAQPSDVLFYVPRSLQIALFAPFPDTWFTNGVSPGSRIMRSVAALEMLIAYLLMPGIVFSLVLGSADKRKLVLLGLAIALPIMSLYAIVIPDVGTLYRMRFGCFALLLGLSIIGWAEFLSWFRKRGMPATGDLVPPARA